MRYCFYSMGLFVCCFLQDSQIRIFVVAMYSDYARDLFCEVGAPKYLIAIIYL